MCVINGVDCDKIGMCETQLGLLVTVILVRLRRSVRVRACVRACDHLQDKYLRIFEPFRCQVVN